MLFFKKMLTEVIIPMSVTEEHTNSSWNLSAINRVSAVDGKNLLTEVGMAAPPTRSGHFYLSKVRPKSVNTFFRKRCCDSNLSSTLNWHVVLLRVSMFLLIILLALMGLMAVAS
jgi:hypothetical protein